MKRTWQSVSAEAAKSHPLYGVGGWLVLVPVKFALSMSFSVIFLVLEAGRVGASLSDLLTFDNGFLSFFYAHMLILGSSLAVVIWLMLSKSPAFRTTASIALLAYMPLIGLAAVLIDPSAKIVEALGGDFLRWAISCIIWVTYLQRSRRVRVTFEHKLRSDDEYWVLAEELAHPPAPVPGPAPAASTLQPPRLEATKQDEEALWSEAYDEVNGSHRRQGLWAKAFALSSGDESAARAYYLKERVHQLAEERRSILAESAPALPEQSLPQPAAHVAARSAKRVRVDFLAGRNLTPDDVKVLVSAIDTEPELARARDKVRGSTLLHWCAKYGLVMQAQALLSQGAVAAAPDGSGRKAYELAENAQMREVLLTADSDRVSG